jgi:hypothetical protein
MIKTSDLSFQSIRGSGRMATNLGKNLIFGSFGVAGFVAILALLDIILGVPFAHSTTMDILFLLSAAIVGYLGWDAFKDMG